MNFIYRIRAVFIVTFKRLWAQKGLTSMTVIGLTVAVGLITTVPLYADAVNFRVLEETLGIHEPEKRGSPFGFMYDYIGPWHGAVEYQEILALDDYLRGEAVSLIDLPIIMQTRHLETDVHKLFSSGTTNYEEDQLALVYMATTRGLAENIILLEGILPVPAAAGTNTPIEVMVTEAFATELGIQIGDLFTVYGFKEKNPENRDQIPVRISGIWRAVDPDSAFWFFNPDVFDDLLVVNEESFVNRLAPELVGEVNLGVWNFVYDGSKVGTEDVGNLRNQAREIERRADLLLPNAGGRRSPLDAMETYQRKAKELTLLLTSFDVPIVGLILAFIALVVGLAVDQRRSEIAVLRSRGATHAQVVGIAAMEGVFMGVIAWGLGTLLGLGLTQLIGRTQSFFDFSAESFLRVSITYTSLQAGGLAIGLALISQVIPTIAASRNTIVTYKQEQARSVTRPWWQRAWLDVLLLIPTFYGYYLLQIQGTLFVPSEAGSVDLFQNPLLLLLPVLTVFSITLFLLRVLPWILEGVSWVLFRLDSVGLLMAAWQLARTPRLYFTPIFLLVLTTSLSVFTASFALTVDYQLFDEQLYRIGADVNLFGAGRPFMIANSFAPQQPVEIEGLFLPMSEYEDFGGITAATRVAEYLGSAAVGNDDINVKFIGVDRTTFGTVAFWRWDFARFQLGSMMNALAISPDAILVSRKFLQEGGNRVGDFIRLDVSLSGDSVALNAQIAGVLDYFPTWYPEEDGHLFVGNLDTIFALAGGEFPYEVWLRTNADFSEAAFENELDSRGLTQWRWTEPYETIQLEQTRPERQGLFGLLSVGFIASAVLTVIGFFLYAYFSFRKRYIELGILRAIGLPQHTMGVYVAAELAFLVLSGLTLGTVLGVWVSRQYIPSLHVDLSAGVPVPPYLVEIAWPAVFQIYGIFVIMFAVALFVLVFLLRRMRIFEAVKLGETT